LPLEVHHLGLPLPDRMLVPGEHRGPLAVESDPFDQDASERAQENEIQPEHDEQRHGPSTGIHSGVSLPSRRSPWAGAEPDLCLTDPGFEVDLYVDAELAAMAKVWLGDLPFERALRSNAVQLTGARALVQTFPSWLLLSPFARVRRPAARTG
jgi:hypothetical protein